VLVEQGDLAGALKCFRDDLAIRERLAQYTNDVLFRDLRLRPDLAPLDSQSGGSSRPARAHISYHLSCL
jgi:hypothetical protein